MLRQAMIKQKTKNKKPKEARNKQQCGLQTRKLRRKKREGGGERRAEVWGQPRTRTQKKPRGHLGTRLINEHVCKKDTLSCDPDDSLTHSTSAPVPPTHSFSQPTHSFRTHSFIPTPVSTNASRSKLKLFGGKQAGRHAIHILFESTPPARSSLAFYQLVQTVLSFFFFLSWQNNLPTERSKKNILGPTSGACLLAVTRHAIVRSTPRRCTGACGVEE